MRRFDVRRGLDSATHAEVEELLEAAWRADGARPLNDHMWLDLREGGRTGYAGVIAREDGHSHVIGYCQVSRGNKSWQIDLVVHPHHRYDMNEIGPTMLRHAVDIIASEGGGHLHWWVFEANSIHADLALGAGLRPGRRLLQMRRPLPLEPGHLSLIDGFTTEPFRPGTDEDEWLALNNAAFGSHPEQGGWTRETIASREKEPWFDPGSFLLHRIDGRLAGFCWMKMHHGNDGPAGEIYAIGVDPGATSRGLGRRLAVAGLAHAARDGATGALLYVDADNQAALHIYGELGFRTHHTEHAFTGDIAPR